MSGSRRLGLCVLILAFGVAAQAALEQSSDAPRPLLKQKLATIPIRLGSWAGEDVNVDARVLEKSQATDYLSRIYHDSRRPGRQLQVWINYSETGLNLRHTPEICLPSGGWTKIESQCRVMRVKCSAAGELPITRLAYGKGELVQGIGFWYYIFGEGQLEHFVRSLPITSQSSHGRATRGSGLTVEVFCPGEADPDGQALQDFASALLAALEPILPGSRACYHIP
ncbi:MAG TPA: EpsI family protein [Isosphaeraceae bacterium]|jgi:hypothetical protein|nr:EpsI family protein [Isosphaeraceae bacterium]